VAHQDAHVDADAKRGGFRGIIELFGKPKAEHRPDGDADPLLMPPRNGAGRETPQEPPSMVAPSITPMRDAHVASDPGDLISAFDELERIANEASGNHRGPLHSFSKAPATAVESADMTSTSRPRVTEPLSVLAPADLSSLAARVLHGDSSRRARGESEDPKILSEPRFSERLVDEIATSPEATAPASRENPIAKLGRIHDKLKTERDQARAERDQRKAENTRLLEEVEKADRRVDAAKDDIAALRRTIAERDAEIDDLKHRLAKYDELDVKFQLMMSKARAVTEESKKAADVLRDELAAERRKNAELLASINDLVAKADMP
jgi:hypothetical protein